MKWVLKLPKPTTSTTIVLHFKPLLFHAEKLTIAASPSKDAKSASVGKPSHAAGFTEDDLGGGDDDDEEAAEGSDDEVEDAGKASQICMH